jgi:hypothetical protein
VQGFKTARLTRNTLAVNTPLVVDVALEVGEMINVVSVEARAELLQTSNATIGNVVTSKEVTELPLNGRNPLTLLVLEPGVVQRSYGGAGSGIHVNGSRDRAYNVTIDGIEANESTVPNPVSNLYRLTPDNIQEFKVTTSNQTPEEGRNSGASISIATGAQCFPRHCILVFRNTDLINEFYASAERTKPDIKMNQYGAELSGPIRRNKTFSSLAGPSESQHHSPSTKPSRPVIYTPTLRRLTATSPPTESPFVLNGRPSRAIVRLGRSQRALPGVATAPVRTDQLRASYGSPPPVQTSGPTRPRRAPPVIPEHLHRRHGPQHRQLLWNV